MFQKNIRIYRITENLQLDFELLERAMAEHKCVPPTGQEAVRIGFTEPVKSVKRLSYAGQDGLLMIAAKRSEKVLPAAVVEEELQPKIDALEAEKCRPLGRKEKQELKEELVQSLLPRAFTRSTVTNAVIDVRQNLIFVFTTSASRAEELLALLRKSLGSLPLVPWIDSNLLSICMQQWILQQALPAQMQLGHSVEFKAPDEEGAMARFANQVLTVAEVQNCAEDKMVRKVELVIPERLSFTVSDDGSIKGIDWHDVVMTTNNELGWDDYLARTDADLLISVQELRHLVSAISNTVQPAEPQKAA